MRRPAEVFTAYCPERLAVCRPGLRELWVASCPGVGHFSELWAPRCLAGVVERRSDLSAECCLCVVVERRSVLSAECRLCVVVERRSDPSVECCLCVVVERCSDLSAECRLCVVVGRRSDPSVECCLSVVVERRSDPSVECCLSVVVERHPEVAEEYSWELWVAYCLWAGCCLELRAPPCLGVGRHSALLEAAMASPQEREPVRVYSPTACRLGSRHRSLRL